MKFIIAPDKFKGSLTGIEFCNAVEEGILKVLPKAELVKIPLADGGDGTMDALLHSLKGEKVSVEVHNPIFKKIEANYLWVAAKQLAVIEMAEASGLSLLKKTERNCRNTTSLGTGELILDAIEKGAKTIVLGIGGSATNDAGMGMATALGYQFLDAQGNLLKPIGENLEKISKIEDAHKISKLKEVSFKIACDVTNPLYGSNGAAFVYGPQKGASPFDVELLDKGLKNFSRIVLEKFNVDCQQISGAGAAGGMGAGSLIFLDGVLESGISLVKEITDFDVLAKGADWILTGEGKLDNQTMSGKTIQGVLETATKNNIPVAAFCGAVELTEEMQENLGLCYVTAVSKGIVDIDTAMKNAYENVKYSAYNFARLL